MDKNITPNFYKFFDEKEVVAPSQETISFLKYFAYTYHVEKSLPEPFNELCVN